MFLFRKKNENSEIKPAEPTKAELFRPDKSKTGKPEKARGKTVEAERVVETIERPLSDSPLKVVIPASALKEEEAKDPVQLTASIPLPTSVPDEVVDSFLKPGHQSAAKPDEATLAFEPGQVKKTQSDPVLPKLESAKAVKEGEGKENMFSSLFGQPIEEEENSLARLITSLPEITIEEVLSEADEVKNLMKEYSCSHES
jgi:hypothetical protein